MSRKQAVGAQHERAHPLDHRFGAPNHWSGYQLIRAMALMLAQQVVGERDAEAVCAQVCLAMAATALHRMVMSDGLQPLAASL